MAEEWTWETGVGVYWEHSWLLFSRPRPFAATTAATACVLSQLDDEEWTKRCGDMDLGPDLSPRLVEKRRGEGGAGRFKWKVSKSRIANANQTENPTGSAQRGKSTASCSPTANGQIAGQSWAGPSRRWQLQALKVWFSHKLEFIGS